MLKSVTNAPGIFIQDPIDPTDKVGGAVGFCRCLRGSGAKGPTQCGSQCKCL